MMRWEGDLKGVSCNSYQQCCPYSSDDLLMGWWGARWPPESHKPAGETRRRCRWSRRRLRGITAPFPRQGRQNWMAEGVLLSCGLSGLGPRRAFGTWVVLRGVGLNPQRVPAPAPMRETQRGSETSPRHVAPQTRPIKICTNINLMLKDKPIPVTLQGGQIHWTVRKSKDRLSGWGLALPSDS